MWSDAEFERRTNVIVPAPTIQTVVERSERYRILVLILQSLGIDGVIQFGELADWKAAIADLENKDRALELAHLDEVLKDDDKEDPLLESYQVYARTE